MFKGFVSTVDQVGRTMATVTVASAPRRARLRHAAQPLLADLRPHALRLGLRRRRAAPSRASGTAAAGSNASTIILVRRERADHAQGSLVWLSGANANVRATVKSVVAGRVARAHVSAAVRARRRRRLHRLSPAATTRNRPAQDTFRRTSRTSAASPTSRRRRWLTDGHAAPWQPRPLVADRAPRLDAGRSTSAMRHSPPSARPSSRRRAPGSARPIITPPTSRASASIAP